jgi:hypothetical protein
MSDPVNSSSSDVERWEHTELADLQGTSDIQESGPSAPEATQPQLTPLSPQPQQYSAGGTSSSPELTS